jgi:hypothetical protein
MRKCFLFVVILLVALAPVALAQQQSTTGSIEGRVLDPQGAAVPGAKVTVTGAKGTTSVVADANGAFEVRNLDPGNYALSIEMQGFKTAKIDKVEVVIGKANTVTASLEVGAPTETVIVTDVAQIDQSSTAIGSNLNDQLYENIPVQRSVSSLFYLSPSASNGLGGGTDNPSISGGSALDNLYIADGVNITDSAFGGIGTFTRNYGSLGTGITTAFIKEVQVKSGGFEPQYGQATGGIINVVTKSGGNDYHGAIYGYAKPNIFEAEHRHRDEFSVNKVGTSPASFDQIAHEQYDFGVDFGGPIIKDRFFFFGSFNPNVIRDLVEGAHRNSLDIETGKTERIDSGLFRLLGQHVQRYRVLNYALKLDFAINANHNLSFSTFGDPSKTNRSSFINLNTDNTTGFATLDFGTQNTAVRYNGAFGTSNPATLSINFSRGHNHYNESGFDNFNQIIDRTQPDRGNFNAIGYGFFEPTDSTTWRLTVDATKQKSFLGSHTFGIGYQYQRAFYNGFRGRSGPSYAIPSALAPFLPPGAVGQPLNAAFSLFSTAGIQNNPAYPFLDIPGRGFRRVYLRQDRGEFGNTDFDTQSNYHAAYVQDTWRFNKYITAIVGLRWEQEQVLGTPLGADEVANINAARPGANIATGFRSNYTFTGQWSPRFGVTIDPRGRGKTKVYYNFGRYHEYLPLDAAERSLSVEQDFIFSRWSPVTVPCDPAFGLPAGSQCAVRNEFGTVIPQINNAALILPGFYSANDPTQIVNPGTKLGYLDEHVVGFEQQLPRNFTLSVRYIDRRIKRIIEDAAVVSPEAVLAGVGQTYFLGNVSSTLDAGINLEPIINPTPAQAAGCATGVAALADPFGNALGTVCFTAHGINPITGGSINIPDGIPDGFPDPKRIYKAVEVEVNKRFADNWQLLSNVRFASLRGNYEGHLRNDNAQTDPGISSLFDFVGGDFNLLGDQFAIGPLNTDRRVQANIYGSYTLGKEGFGSMLHGLTLGANLHGESGIPISEYFAHPAYGNAGEIPVGGRGKLGRTSPYYRLDLHVDYPWAVTENTRLSFIADFFNVTNNRGILRVNEFRESSAGQLNPDFFAPRWFYNPFSMRLGLRFEF